jgi:hypothetical protein
VHSRIAPLLLCGARAVTCSPGCHTSVIAFLDLGQGYTCGGSLLFQRRRFRKQRLPGGSVLGLLRGPPTSSARRGRAGKGNSIRLKSHIRLRVLPVKGTELVNLLLPPRLIRLAEACVIFFGMEGLSLIFPGLPGNHLLFHRYSCQTVDEGQVLLRKAPEARSRSIRNLPR